MLAVGVACGAPVAANHGSPNTGTADSVAHVSAFDQFAAAGTPANIVILSLSNLRGVSSEAVNAGGQVGIDPTFGVDLWFIDNSTAATHRLRAYCLNRP